MQPSAGSVQEPLSAVGARRLREAGAEVKVRRLDGESVDGWMSGWMGGWMHLMIESASENDRQRARELLYKSG